MAGKNPAVHTAGALAKAFGDLAIPKVMVWMLISALVTIVAAIGLWYLLHWLLFGYELFNWGWVNWVLDLLGGVALFFLLLLLLPALLIIVTSIFVDFIVDAVEAHHYPDLPPQRKQPAGEIVGYLIKFMLLIIGVNILVLPLYLLFPVVNFLLAWIINGYLVGREFFELVAFRRMGQDAMREARRAHGGKIFSGGFLLAMMMSVPLLNLVMPVVSAAYFTHFFHGLPLEYRGKRRA